jgi:S-(hydroxymethyl)glutathione dehydrogenase/alcohol dehydrogenase
VKAAVLREIQSPLTIEEVQIDRPGPREVLIRTGACGVCHSDLHWVEGLRSWPLPTILGHEAAGTVEAVGEQVTYVRPGDRVVTCLSTFCGQCAKCLSGRPSLCTKTDVDRRPDEPPRLSQDGAPIHQFARLSAYAEQMLVHEHSLVKVTPDVPVELQALVGCAVVTGVGAVLNTARIEPGSTVAVIGCGGIGLNCIQGARLGGASRIIGIDRVGSKLDLAQMFGATDVVDATAGDVVEQVRELTGGGVDYSFEALGLKQTAEQSLAMLAPGGTATIIGLLPDGTTLEIDHTWLSGERRLQSSSMGSNRFRTDIPLYLEWYKQGRLKLSELVTRRQPLTAINQCFADMKAGSVARSVIVFE